MTAIGKMRAREIKIKQLVIRNPLSKIPVKMRLQDLRALDFARVESRGWSGR